MNMTAIAIVAIATWGVVTIVRLGVNKSMKDTDNQVNSELESELAQLRDRIEVLEKIVTDEKYDLKKQFADLEKRSA